MNKRIHLLLTCTLCEAKYITINTFILPDENNVLCVQNTTNQFEV